MAYGRGAAEHWERLVDSIRVGAITVVVFFLIWLLSVIVASTGIITINPVMFLGTGTFNGWAFYWIEVTIFFAAMLGDLADEYIW